MDLMNGIDLWDIVVFVAYLWVAWTIGTFIGGYLGRKIVSKELIADEKLAANRVFFRIEPVDQPPHETVLLVFNSVTNKFIGQAMSPEGVVDLVFGKFKDKELYLHSGNIVVPLVRPIAKTIDTVSTL